MIYLRRQLAWEGVDIYQDPEAIDFIWRHIPDRTMSHVQPPDLETNAIVEIAKLRSNFMSRRRL